MSEKIGVVLRKEVESEKIKAECRKVRMNFASARLKKQKITGVFPP